MNNNQFYEKYYLSSDGLKLYYRFYPSQAHKHTKRPVILCLSGLTRNSLDFHDFAVQYQHDFDLICPDYRGRGLSQYDSNWTNYRAEKYAQDILTLLESYSNRDIVIVGTSMGGLLAIGLHQFLEQKLLGAVLNDIGPAVNGNGFARIIQYIQTDKPQKTIEDCLEWLRQLYPLLKNRPLQQQLQFTHATYRIAKDNLFHYNWDTNIAQALKQASPLPTDLWQRFKSFDPKPVLGLRGALSDVLSADTFQQMAQSLPSFTGVTIPGVGHTPSLNEPESLQALHHFIGQFR